MLLWHTAPPTCRASWWGWRRSWWSSWGTRSCRCLAGWCCRFSSDLDLKTADWRPQRGCRTLNSSSLTRLKSTVPPLLCLFASSPARQQLVHQDAQRPVVCGDVVTFVENDLRSDVLRRSAERPRLLTDTDLLGESKVHLGKDKREWMQSCETLTVPSQKCLKQKMETVY